MAENETTTTPESPESEGPVALESGAYEILQKRLDEQGRDLRSRLDTLNVERKKVFGAIEANLIATERVTTTNNCIPRDMVALGEIFLFGYNVNLGLRTQMKLEDVFAAYTMTEHTFKQAPLDLIQDEAFLKDFADLYQYYKKARFAKFAQIGPALFMVFHVGSVATDLKAFKWIRTPEGTLSYQGNRSDHEYTFPSQHEFEWVRTNRDMHHYGIHPHVSIEDRLFVETVGGDLTIKIEDNTDSGDGLYAEPVDDPDQTLDDGEIHYAIVGQLILLKVRPYNEKAYRYFVFSEKSRTAMRIDAIQGACVLLPESHGIIFPNGYFLQNGEYKTFEADTDGMVFERRVNSPNGEDTLFVFYNRESGAYMLLSYNLIEQKVATPIICHGFSLFENGELIYFRHQGEPQKHHAVQIWQTPFVGPDFEVTVVTASYLTKIGNRDIVRAMAECQGILTLIGKEETGANFYVDIVRQTTDLLDAYFWLDRKEAGKLSEPLGQIKKTAKAAVEEFEKVVRVRKEAAASIKAVSESVETILREIRVRKFASVDDFVQSLAQLRKVRGEIISLRDLRYVDLERVQTLEDRIATQTETTAQGCVEFLLGEDALAPYEARIQEQKAAVPDLTKVADAKEVGEQVDQTASDLELLIDVVSNLKIEDTTQRTAIIERISSIYASLNQVRSTLKGKTQDLASTEGKAEFGSQMKLLNQGVVNYLDVCDTPEKAEEYLTKVMIQVEELEGRFADFDDFVLELTDKREEIYNAFESRKLALVEARNKKADALLRSAERILKGIRTRAESYETVEEINGYFAGDLMIEKVRDIVEQLTTLGDSVKADDVQSRLKTVQQDTVRQLKDRSELFVDGENVIKFGPHHFSVNTQQLDLTIVARDDRMCLHMTGTNFFETITDETFLTTQDVWSMEVVSEDRTVYRAEYLAFLLLDELLGADESDAFLGLDEKERIARVQQFMGPRYDEGYVKGVHDHDAAKLLTALLELHGTIGLLRYHAQSRALAMVFWHHFTETKRKAELTARFQGFGAIASVFPAPTKQDLYINELAGLLTMYIEETQLFERHLIPEAAAYLFHVVASGDGHPVSPEAGAALKRFKEQVKRLNAQNTLSDAVKKCDPIGAFRLLRDWVAAFLDQAETPAWAPYCDEIASFLYTEQFDQDRVAHTGVVRELTGLVGNHPRIQEGAYRLDFNEYMLRLARFRDETVPRFRSYTQAKKALVERARDDLRLAEFKPRVLTSFVRNKLIDQVYLPIIGDNLAKQIGVVGEKKRTDLMGLLLLISPPGYGKTTLMEYIANRLGIIFMKVNGPAIGHRVTSLDPAEAPNAAARQELEKLNLSLEMGDNVMLYLDDIQHCNPEFLQKFISLCDGTRKIEGVYKGRTRTYDLRGRKVCVVMAGNPYTESGEKFRIPDMLANRADTYNLGDILGDNGDAFNLSYLENALTSSPVLQRLAGKSRSDIHAVIKMAETDSRDGVQFESNFAKEELDEYVAVLKKLIRVRNVVLTVNQEYIRSAGQSDEYRTEPPFLLQGSYRNMNRMAEKVVPIMNDEELETLILSDYEGEAQTLTSGAEANLLKFKRLIGRASDEDNARWKEITKTFQRNQTFRNVGEDDQVGRVVVQLSTFKDGLDQIREAVQSGIAALAQAQQDAAAAQAKAVPAGPVQTALTPETLESIGKILTGLAEVKTGAEAGATPAVVETRLADDSIQALRQVIEALPTPTIAVPLASSPAPGTAAPSKSKTPQKATTTSPASVPTTRGDEVRVEVVNKVPRGMLKVLQTQFNLMQAWLDPMLTEFMSHSKRLSEFSDSLNEAMIAYRSLMKQIDRGNKSRRDED